MTGGNDDRRLFTSVVSLALPSFRLYGLLDGRIGSGTRLVVRALDYLEKSKKVVPANILYEVTVE